MGFVKAGGEGFLEHWGGGFGQGDEQGQLGFFPFQVAFEGGNHTPVDGAAFDLHDDALGLAAVVVEEVDVAVHAGVGAFAAVAGGAGCGEAQGPPFELVAILLGQGVGAGDILGEADDFVGLQFAAEGVGHAAADDADGEVGDVDADPAAVEALGGGHGGAAAAEGIQHDVAFGGAGGDDAFQEGFRFLGGVAEAFTGLGAEGGYVGNDVLDQNAGVFVGIPFLLGDGAAGRPVNKAGLIQQVQFFLR